MGHTLRLAKSVEWLLVEAFYFSVLVVVGVATTGLAGLVFFALVRGLS